MMWDFLSIDSVGKSLLTNKYNNTKDVPLLNYCEPTA